MHFSQNDDTMYWNKTKEIIRKRIKKVKAACYCCDGGDFPGIIKVVKETKEYKKTHKGENQE